MIKSNVFDFLSEVYIHLKQSESVYKMYLNEGKTYLQAQNLKVHNLKIKSLLVKNSSLLSENLRQDSSLLISHYNAWLKKWNELEKLITPKANDEFIFENDHIFPKQACQNIEQEYLRLQKAKQ